MKNKLQQYFPMIRTREEMNAEIERRPELKKLFFSWSEEAREEFRQEKRWKGKWRLDTAKNN